MCASRKALDDRLELFKLPSRGRDLEWISSGSGSRPTASHLFLCGTLACFHGEGKPAEARLLRASHESLHFTSIKEHNRCFLLDWEAETGGIQTPAPRVLLLRRYAGLLHQSFIITTGTSVLSERKPEENPLSHTRNILKKLRGAKV